MKKIFYVLSLFSINALAVDYSYLKPRVGQKVVIESQIKKKGLFAAYTKKWRSTDIITKVDASSSSCPAHYLSVTVDTYFENYQDHKNSQSSRTICAHAEAKENMPEGERSRLENCQSPDVSLAKFEKIKIKLPVAGKKMEVEACKITKSGGSIKTLAVLPVIPFTLTPESIFEDYLTEEDGGIYHKSKTTVVEVVP